MFGCMVQQTWPAGGVTLLDIIWYFMLQERLATMAQAIVTSQLMNLHFGRLKDQGRLTPVQACTFTPCPRSFHRLVSMD